MSHITVNHSGGTRDISHAHHGIEFATVAGEPIGIRCVSQAITSCELTSQPTPLGEPLAFDGTALTPDVPGRHAVTVTLSSGAQTRFEFIAIDPALLDAMGGIKHGSNMATATPEPTNLKLARLQGVARENPAFEGTLATLKTTRNLAGSHSIRLSQ